MRWLRKIRAILCTHFWVFVCAEALPGGPAIRETCLRCKTDRVRAYEGVKG